MEKIDSAVISVLLASTTISAGEMVSFYEEVQSYDDQSVFICSG